MTALDDTLVPIDPAEEEPDPYVVPGNYPEPIQHFIQICGRGPASFNRNPEEGDLQMLMEGVSDDVEVMVPKVYEVKTVKEGGDPILIHGKEKMEWALTSKRWSELCPLQDNNDDDALDDRDVPRWGPLREIVTGGRRASLIGPGMATNAPRQGRVFRRRCVLHRKLIRERFKQTIVVLGGVIQSITTIEISARV
eukprot:TRINITY_DN8786_c0_g1_i2.p2 TRINITY_DN8786_c0_g1~~TRINITY_DN8786_c0_g1_i2.p2  ORF type:complete len:195 (-),score=43.86 TRINITY_DN8786_c0_g1_i2:280-864(-)